MLTITKEQFENLKNNHKDYFSLAVRTHTHEGKTCHAGKDYCGYESIINGGDTNITENSKLWFEHIHFEIEGRKQEMKELKEYHIKDIENMTEADAKYYCEEETLIKDHNVYFVDFGKPFGYSVLVYYDGHYIYHANDYELHHPGRSREWLKKWYIDTLNNSLFFESELGIVKDYTDYEKKDYFLRNLYSMRRDYVSIFGIFTTEEEERKHRKAIEGKTYNPITFAYYTDENFVKNCIMLSSNLEKALENKTDDFEYWKDAFKKEMYNHEYMINWQGNYDTLSAFGCITWNGNDDEIEYFKELDFSQVQRNAWYAARKEYWKEAENLY